ncbi:MAG: hypothetical protein LBI69_05180 [Puniceicoccales bacterium]|jgi:hypothetical protein|nr:hypothetical protein [Puniceicoccales bacterium]
MVDISSFQLGLLGAGNPRLVENEQKISSSTLLEGKELAILLPAVNARGYRFGRIFRYFLIFTIIPIPFLIIFGKSWLLPSKGGQVSHTQLLAQTFLCFDAYAKNSKNKSLENAFVEICKKLEESIPDVQTNLSEFLPPTPPPIPMGINSPSAPIRPEEKSPGPLLQKNTGSSTASENSQPPAPSQQTEIPTARNEISEIPPVPDFDQLKKSSEPEERSKNLASGNEEVARTPEQKPSSQPFKFNPLPNSELKQYAIDLNNEMKDEALVNALNLYGLNLFDANSGNMFVNEEAILDNAIMCDSSVPLSFKVRMYAGLKYDCLFRSILVAMQHQCRIAINPCVLNQTLYNEYLNNYASDAALKNILHDNPKLQPKNPNSPTIQELHALAKKAIEMWEEKLYLGTFPCNVSGKIENFTIQDLKKYTYTKFIENSGGQDPFDALNMNFWDPINDREKVGDFIDAFSVAKYISKVINHPIAIICTRNSLAINCVTIIASENLKTKVIDIETAEEIKQHIADYREKKAIFLYQRSPSTGSGHFMPVLEFPSKD